MIIFPDIQLERISDTFGEKKKENYKDEVTPEVS
jgi:hypothetical protein